MLSNRCQKWSIVVAKRLQSSAAVASSSNAAATSQPSSSEIKIPMRIKRSPTDILKALASTVKEDETAFPYKFYDDPRLLPGGDMSKRICALSKEAGRQAAHYLVTKFPTLFMWDQDEPRLEAWRPIGRPGVEVGQATEQLLLDRIERCWVTNCVNIYERLKSENKRVSRETQMKLLELLCYYNCDEPAESQWTERMFYRSFLNSPSSSSPWKSNGPAMKLFDELEIKDSRAYSAVMCGMAKFKAYDLCRPLYEKMVEANFKPDLNTFHALLKCVQYVRSEPKNVWDSIENILTSIRENNIRPTIVTFNLAMLAVINRLKKYDGTENRCLQLFREMVSLNIEPSLTTFYCILYYHDNLRNVGSYVEAVLKMVENREHGMVMEEDNLFLPYTMALVCDRLRNLDFAYRLHSNVLKYGKNYLFFNDAETEKYYYDRFFVLLSRYEETSKFFAFYNSLVPHIYSPSPQVISEILSNLEMTGAVDRIPDVYNSMLHLGYGLTAQKVMEVVRMMFAAGNLEMDVRRSFAETSFKIRELIDAQYKIQPRQDGKLLLSPKRLKWNGRLIGQLAVLSARGGQFQRSFETFQKVFPPKLEETKQAMIEKGTFPEQPPDLPIVNEYVRTLVEANQIDKCYFVLKYMKEIGMTNEVSRWVNQLNKSPIVHVSEKRLFKALATEK